MDIGDGGAGEDSGRGDGEEEDGASEHLDLNNRVGRQRMCGLGCEKECVG